MKGGGKFIRFQDRVNGTWMEMVSREPRGMCVWAHYTTATKRGTKIISIKEQLEWHFHGERGSGMEHGRTGQCIWALCSTRMCVYTNRTMYLSGVIVFRRREKGAQKPKNLWSQLWKKASSLPQNYIWSIRCSLTFLPLLLFAILITPKMNKDRRKRERILELLNQDNCRLLTIPLPLFSLSLSSLCACEPFLFGEGKLLLLQ